LKSGDAEGALRELTRAAYLDPYSARAHEPMARAYAARGEKGKAVSELQMSLWCKDDLAVRLALARALGEAGRAVEARAEAEKVLRSDPANAEAKELAKKPLPPPRPRSTP
jgi:Tfp pilus assembly protein PilF